MGKSPAEKYGVNSFDLGKKALVVKAAENFMPNTDRGIYAFCGAVNELHFDGDTGRLVSEADARKLAEASDDARKLFEEFLTKNKPLIFGD